MSGSQLQFFSEQREGEGLATAGGQRAVVFCHHFYKFTYVVSVFMVAWPLKHSVRSPLCLCKFSVSFVSICQMTACSHLLISFVKQWKEKLSISKTYQIRKNHELKLMETMDQMWEKEIRY